MATREPFLREPVDSKEEKEPARKEPFQEGRKTNSPMFEALYATTSWEKTCRGGE
jgi:hypothetical protein